MSEISRIYDALNNIPVDNIAASMFWKTPWWAEVPEKVAIPVCKMVLDERMPPESINIDHFKPPPKFGPINNVTDRRGIKVMRSGGRIALITGYAHYTLKNFIMSPSIAKRKPYWWKGDGWDGSRYIGKKTKNKEHKWWALCEGRFEIVNARSINRNIIPE